MRQLAAYEAKKAEFDAVEATIYAASVDTLDQAQEVAARGFTFPIAYGVTMEEAEKFGAWQATDQHGTYIQPSEFLLGRGGVVLGSMYASGQVGRMGADEALTFIDSRLRPRDAEIDLSDPGRTTIGDPMGDPRGLYPKPPVNSRAAWGALPPQCTYSYCTVTHIATHHTAGVRAPRVTTL